MLIIHSPDNIFTILVSIFKSNTLVVLGLLKYCKSSEILQVSHFRRHDLFLQFYLSCIFLLFSCSFGDKAAMAQSMPFIALGATLLLSTFSCCSAENVYCVRPTLAPNTRAHPVLTVILLVPHFLSMHKTLNSTSPPIPRWCSCQVTTLLM